MISKLNNLILIRVFVHLAKEIRLKHKAPVLSILVLNSQNQSIGQGSNIPTNDSDNHQSESTVNSTNNSEHSISHKVLICSEEQFKVKQKNFFSFSFVHFPCLDLYITTFETIW